MTSETHWFVRRGSGWCCSIQPSSLAGWLLTGAYSAAVTLIAATLAADDLQSWPVWAVVIAAMTVLFVVVSYRMSVPAKGRRGSGCDEIG